MRKHALQGFVVGMLLGVMLLVAVGSVLGSTWQSGWEEVTILVPRDGYFSNHGRCQAEDVTLGKVTYPDGNKWRCYHIDRW